MKSETGAFVVDSSFQGTWHYVVDQAAVVPGLGTGSVERKTSKWESMVPRDV
jgi:hypothetical protein